MYRRHQYASTRYQPDTMPFSTAREPRNSIAAGFFPTSSYMPLAMRTDAGSLFNRFDAAPAP